MSRNQRTLASAIQLKGSGLHTGADISVELVPAEAFSGVVFVRKDLEGQPRIAANHKNALKRQRQTVIAENGAEVQTVEHLLAALNGLEIDNVEVHIDGPELPCADGSAREFCEALAAVETVEQKAPRKHFSLDKTVVVEDGDRAIVALPHEGGLRVSYTLDYGRPGQPVQHSSFLVDPETFLKEIAPARTFCLESEARQLQDKGFGQGANTENTLVIREDGDVIDNKLRFPDEFARHKILDLIGDLALLGADVSAHIIATRTGHMANVDLVKRLSNRVEEAENLGLVQRDTGIDIKEIMKIIPHRYPFLFLDRVIEIEGFQRAVAIKNVSINEPHFMGHWPDQPIMPGVLQVEALAQLAGVLFMRRMQNTGKVAVLMSIDTIKFRRPVVPGDQLRLECETLNIRRKSGKVIGRGTVGGELTVESVLKFMLMDE